MKRLKETRGITIIALVITIIVLLILAGVSIAMLTGDNGILTRAKKGLESNSEGETEEKIRLAYSDYQIAKKLDQNYTFENALQKSNVNYTDFSGDDTNGYEITAILSDGREKIYYLDSTGSLAIIGKWKDNGDGTYSNTKDKLTVQIGDKVEYNEKGFESYTTDVTKGIGGSAAYNVDDTGRHKPSAKTYNTEDLKWRVLGINEKGKLELISENAMTDSICLANEEGYLYGPDELNKICNTLYGNGTTDSGKKVALTARSLNVKDLLNLANRKPESVSGYGALWQYQFPEDGDYMQYRKSTDDGQNWTEWEDITNLDYQTFRMPGANEDTTISKENPGIITVKNTFYSFSSMTNKMTQTTRDGKNMGKIIGYGIGADGEFNSRPANQWLADNFVYCDANRAHFYVFFLNWCNMGIRYPNDYDIYHSNGSHWYMSFRIRPVITLNSNIELVKDESTDTWNIK